MDTRNKILTAAAARELDGPVAMATGTFNPLCAEEARELAAFRERIGDVCLLVVVLPAGPELLPTAARAELAAGLRVVDRVVAGEAEELLAALHPVAVLHLPDATGALIERVQAASTRR